MPPSLKCLFRYRCVFQDVLFSIRNETIQLLLFPIHASKDRGRRQQLKRAAHWKQFAGPILNAFAAACVESSNTDSTATALLNRRDTICNIICEDCAGCR